LADRYSGQRAFPLKGSKVLALGVTYKRDANDLRESPALEVLRGLSAKGALVSYADPFIPALTLNDTLMESMNVVPETLQSMDCLVVLTDHSCFDYEMIVAESPLIVDCRNVLKHFPRSNIFSF
jgi:UDP-N-acetyl-D-glucosamine dehydrogenase